MRLLGLILVVVALFYVLFGSFLYWNQKSLIFFPSKNMAPKPAGLEDVHFITSDGVKLHGWYFKTPEATKTALFFHGNAGNLSHRGAQFQIFQELGINGLIIDYRGYGQSEGEIETEDDIYKDANAAWEFLIEEQGIVPEDIIIWGRSLGGVPAIHLGQNKNVHGVIAESTFFSADLFAQDTYWFFPVSWFARFHFRNDLKIPNLTSKVLIIHSPEDEIVSYSYGKKLFEQATEPKQFLEINGSHNSGFIDSQELYMATIRDFLSS